MKQPFQASAVEIEQDLEVYVDAVYASLESQFLVLPKGGNFVEYPRFQEAYETLKRATKDFRELRPSAVWDALLSDSLSAVVLRCILGMSPPEWAELAASDSGLPITQNFARSLDGKVRSDREYLARLSSRKAATLERVDAMVETACRRVSAGVTETGARHLASPRQGRHRRGPRLGAPRGRLPCALRHAALRAPARPTVREPPRLGL